MVNRNIVVIGGSAGAGSSVVRLLEELAPDPPAAIFIALHLSPTSQEWLAERFRPATSLRIETPRGEQPIEEGHIYVVRPDQHLIVKKGRVIASRGPRENMWRPAVDVLFRTAAVAYGGRVIGVLLSGGLDDGTAGLQAIKARGGIAIVQDPLDAAFPAMPATALANLAVDYCVPLAQMAALLTRLVEEPAGPDIPVTQELRREALMADEDADTARLHAGQQGVTGLSCPECSGPLWRSGPDGANFRCLVGHAYRLDSLMQGADQEIDRTLWAAIRLFEQRANIARMMAEREHSQGRERRAEMHESSADESHQHAQTLRSLHAQRDIVPDAQKTE